MPTTTKPREMVKQQLSDLPTYQLHQLFLERLTREDIIDYLSAKTTLEEVSGLPPAMGVLKARVRTALGIEDTQEIKKKALAQGWLEQKHSDMRRKTTWLTLWEKIKLNCTEVYSPEKVLQPDTIVALDSMNVRQLREIARDVKLPKYGNYLLPGNGGAEALRAALKQFLG